MTEEKEGFELSFKNKVVGVYFWIIVPAAILSIFISLFTNVPSIITSLFSVVTLVGFFVWLIIYLRKQKNKQNSEQCFVLFPIDYIFRNVLAFTSHFFKICPH